MVFHTRVALAEDYDLSQSQINEYQNNGHILLRNLSKPKKKDFQKAFRITQNLWEINDVVRAHVLSKRYAGIAAKFLGCRDVRVYHDLTFFKEGLGKGKPTPWHQDGHYWPLDTEKCITLWVPLLDCPVDMGPMSFVSGSHLNKDAEHLPISDESDEYIRNLGDATFHSCWTYHAAASNTTENTRIAFAIAYYDADATIPLEPPTNERRAANLARWFPGAVPGGPAATEINPAILSPRD
ncbi:phytanoyl-CoA dioxygenase [Pisolithus orientalis]|uniref:phytanoyl-CoA dioxygenase n=1 Tax=Pisolithus orientalis TaxID=936130 RepID=UPI00222495BE|nr:phytanoyl-CoA dioxygenase [Pisolithus orientalis]KAI5996530.1 phytanoyl-CoA dioxygenase [Pisolithus orientalis]